MWHSIETKVVATLRCDRCTNHVTSSCIDPHRAKGLVINSAKMYGWGKFCGLILCPDCFKLTGLDKVD